MICFTFIILPLDWSPGCKFDASAGKFCAPLTTILLGWHQLSRQKSLHQEFSPTSRDITIFPLHPIFTPQSLERCKLAATCQEPDTSIPSCELPIPSIAFNPPCLCSTCIPTSPFGTTRANVQHWTRLACQENEWFDSRKWFGKGCFYSRKGVPRFLFAILIVVDLLFLDDGRWLWMNSLCLLASTKLRSLPGRGKGAHGKGATGLLGTQMLVGLYATKDVVVR